MTKVPRVLCPECKSDSRCTGIRRDGNFCTGAMFGRRRICKNCWCKFTTIYRDGQEVFDSVVEPGAMSFELEEVIEPVTDIDDLEPEPELSDTWKDLYQMRRALYMGVRDNVKWFGRARDNEGLNALAGQIRAAKKNGMLQRAPQPTWVI